MIDILYSFLAPKNHKRRHVCYESPRRAIIVEGTSGWRQLKKGEKDAGLLSSLDQVLVSSWRCEICGIGIGAGYNQEYMYLYPVYREFANAPKSDNKPRFYFHKTLKICGECAAHPKRQLPQWLCVLTPEIYSSTILLCEEGEESTALSTVEQMKRVAAAIEEYIDCRRYFIYLLHLLSFNVSLRWYFSMMTDKKKMDTASIVKEVKATTGSWRHTITPRIPVGQDSLDLIYTAIHQARRPVFPQSSLFS